MIRYNAVCEHSTHNHQSLQCFEILKYRQVVKRSCPGPRPRRPCGSLLCQAPVPGHPPRGRRVRGRHDAQAAGVQDARRSGQASQGRPGRGQLPECSLRSLC